MLKKLFLILIFLWPTIALSGSSDFSGSWFFARDIHLDGNVTKDAKRHLINCNAHHNKFTCSYIGKDSDNDSIFFGETDQARTTKIISFKQFDATYYVTHSGRETVNGEFIGTWYDVAGNSGDFLLQKQ